MKKTPVVSKFFMACLFLIPLLLIPMFANLGSEAASEEEIAPNRLSETAPEGGDLPDLAIESFTILPTNPHTYEPAKITIVARNVGSASVAGRRVNLYIDPKIDPPSNETPETKSFVVGVEWPAGDAMVMEYDQFTFDTPGCNHVVYAWVDPLERIEESDETNNRKAIQVCVENEPIEADVYEEDDSCNENIPEIGINGITQVHNFYPRLDIDWVRFYATQGIQYTVVAAGTGEQASPGFEIGESCDINDSFGGTTSTLSYVARSTGWHYLKLKNDVEDYDPILSTYELSVREVLTGTIPQITKISPTSSFSDMTKSVEITGTQFSFPPSAYLCPYENDRCSRLHHCNQLINTSWVSIERLIGTVPAGLKAGRYCLMVSNPDGVSNTLMNSFTVEAKHGVNLPVLLMQPVPPPTPTPTPKPYPYPDPVPPPTPTPIITNGDFESGTLGGWNASGELPSSVRGGESPSSSYAALLGNPKLGEGYPETLSAGRAYIEQQITVPPDGTPRLIFWYRMISYDVLIGAASGRVWDTLDVTINGVKKNPLFRTGNPDGAGQGAPPYDSNWQQREIDLSDYRGESVTLRFAVWNREYDEPADGLDLFNSWVYIDDIHVVR